jgi:hypothetical protein
MLILDGCQLVQKWLPVDLLAPTYFSGALIAGVAAMKLIEIPALKLRDQWFPSYEAALGDTATPQRCELTVSSSQRNWRSN